MRIFIQCKCILQFELIFFIRLNLYLNLNLYMFRVPIANMNTINYI